MDIDTTIPLVQNTRDIDCTFVSDLGEESTILIPVGDATLDQYGYIRTLEYRYNDRGSTTLLKLLPSHQNAYRFAQIVGRMAARVGVTFAGNYIYERMGERDEKKRMQQSKFITKLVSSHLNSGVDFLIDQATEYGYYDIYHLMEPEAKKTRVMSGWLKKPLNEEEDKKMKEKLHLRKENASKYGRNNFFDGIE